jgi:hypothetical protein
MTDYKALYEQQLAENKELQKALDFHIVEIREMVNKNKDLEDRCESTALERDGLIDDIDTMVMEKNQLQEEIEDLKEEVEERTTYAVLPAEGQFMEENEKLKEENKQLKDQIERERYEHNKEIMKQQDAHYLEEVSPLEKQVEELSEENEKFKKERNTIWETMSKEPALLLLLPDSMYDADMESESESEDEEEESEEMKKLLKENEELKKKILDQ